MMFLMVEGEHPTQEAKADGPFRAMPGDRQWRVSSGV
jgi:hypothetical protein